MGGDLEEEVGNFFSEEELNELIGFMASHPEIKRTIRLGLYGYLDKAAFDLASNIGVDKKIDTIKDQIRSELLLVCLGEELAGYGILKTQADYMKLVLPGHQSEINKLAKSTQTGGGETSPSQ